MGILESLTARYAKPGIDPLAETSVVSIPLYRRSGDGSLEAVQRVEPAVGRGANGLFVRLIGHAAYYLDQIEKWPAGGTVCIHSNGHRSLYVLVDDVHRAVAAALALRQALRAR